MKYLIDPMFWIAVWGGTTGTAAIVFTWFKYRQDRSDLAVNTKFSLATDKPETLHRWRFEIILRNKGRRLCYVEQAAIEMEVKSMKWGERELKTTGPVLFHLYKGQEHGVIRLGEHEKHSIVIFPFPDVYIDMMKASGNDATLLIVDSLGQEHRHICQLPPDDMIKIYREKISESEGK